MFKTEMVSEAVEVPRLCLAVSMGVTDPQILGNLAVLEADPQNIVYFVLSRAIHLNLYDFIYALLSAEPELFYALAPRKKEQLITSGFNEGKGDGKIWRYLMDCSSAYIRSQLPLKDRSQLQALYQEPQFWDVFNAEGPAMVTGICERWNKGEEKPDDAYLITALLKKGVEISHSIVLHDLYERFPRLISEPDHPVSQVIHDAFVFSPMKPEDFRFALVKTVLLPEQTAHLQNLLDQIEFTLRWTPYKTHQFFRQVLAGTEWADTLPSSVRTYYYAVGSTHELKHADAGLKHLRCALPPLFVRAIDNNIASLPRYQPTLGWIKLHHFPHPLLDCTDESIERFQKLLHKFPDWPSMNKNFFKGQFLLHHYASDGQIECMKVLLTHLMTIDFDARFDAYCEGQIEYWPYEEEYFPHATDYIDSLDSAGWAALDCAAEAGPTYPENKGSVISAIQIEIVRLLLAAGADPDLYDRHHHKPRQFELNPTLGDVMNEAIRCRGCKEVAAEAKNVPLPAGAHAFHGAGGGAVGDGGASEMKPSGV